MRKATRQRPNKQQQAPGSGQSLSGLNFGCNQWQFTPLIRGDQIGLRHVMFAVLPTLPFILWRDELIFNHSEEEWRTSSLYWLILLHALAGLTAFLTGPLQFSSLDLGNSVGQK